MVRRSFSLVAALAVTMTLAVGCGSGADNAGAPAPVVPSAPSASAPTTPAEPTQSAQPTQTAEPTQSPEKPKDDKLRRGDKGPEVTALQRRLTELGYWNGRADGSFGLVTQQAVYALQKAAGIGRDGVVGAKTRKALADGVRPKARSGAGSGRVVEINRKRQLLMLVDDGEIEQVFNTSTGTYEHYEYEGQTYLADTPAGRFRVSRQIDGWRDAPLGLLWRPKYFNGGIAVHGSYSIPPYAASHGCARLSIPAMNWIWNNDKMPRGTKVWVY
ncbi:MAG TPA: peptidoglycan-binding protein [Actinoplanes sp.]|nr:peptidoglycan-binding protein [Actinoplanes sp.]